MTEEFPVPDRSSAGARVRGDHVGEGVPKRKDLTEGEGSSRRLTTGA
jgi:hypothetical protein